MTASFGPPTAPVVDEHTPARTTAQGLRNILRINASASILCGAVAATFAASVDELLGTHHPGWVRLVGSGLVAFGAAVLFVAGRRTSSLRRWTPVVVAADAGWVLATAVTVIDGWFAAWGIVAMVAVGTFVGGCAIGQWSGVLRLGRVDVAAIDEFPPVEVVHVRARIGAPAEEVWPVVIDHELYGRLAPNLGSVQRTSVDGPGLTRVCSTRGGAQWSESCTLWDDGRRFEVAVDTADYPYPLEEMRGSWWVTPSSDGSLVGMDFRLRPTPGVRGAAFVVLMQLAFPLVLRRIIGGWRRAAAARSPRANDD